MCTIRKTEGTVYFNLYGEMETSKQKPKFKTGDKVRISKYKRNVFDKGYPCEITLRIPRNS